MTAPDRPGDRDQQQAAEVAVQCEFRGRTVLTPAIAAALAAARAEEAARWQEKIEALAKAFDRDADDMTRDYCSRNGARYLANHLRALLDGDR